MDSYNKIRKLIESEIETRENSRSKSQAFLGASSTLLGVIGGGASLRKTLESVKARRPVVALVEGVAAAASLALAANAAKEALEATYGKDAVIQKQKDLIKLLK